MGGEGAKGAAFGTFGFPPRLPVRLCGNTKICPDLPSNWLSAYSDAELCPAAFAGWSLAGVGQSQCQAFRVKRGISSNCSGGIGFENVGAKIKQRISRRRRGCPKVKPRGTCACLSAPFLASATCLAIPWYLVLTAFIFRLVSALCRRRFSGFRGHRWHPKGQAPVTECLNSAVLPSNFSFPAAWPGSVPEGARGVPRCSAGRCQDSGGKAFLIRGFSFVSPRRGGLYCHGGWRAERYCSFSPVFLTPLIRPRRGGTWRPVWGIRTHTH